LYNSKIDQLPASWSSAIAKKEGEVTNGGHANGHSNGHSNGNGHSTNQVPESFIQDKFVRTKYGLVPLKFALDWPVFASYDELAGCAAWMGGRIPTFEEAKSIYAHVNKQKRAEAGRILSKTVPAVNG
jgi:hypothetical protein